MVTFLTIRFYQITHIFMGIYFMGKYQCLPIYDRLQNNIKWIIINFLVYITKELVK